MTVFERLASIAAKFQPRDRPADLLARGSPTEATLYLYEAITPPDFGGISARDVVAALAEANGVKTLHVRINSVGGSVMEGKAIYQQLKEFLARKVVHVDGLAASIASVVAMTGDEIISSAESTWFIHGAQAFTMGGEREHREMADLLAKESANLLAIYQRRTRQPEADLKAWMDAETFMNAEEAKARGFTDRIEGESPTAASRKVAALSAETKFRIAQATAAATRIARDRASPAAIPGQPGNPQ